MYALSLCCILSICYVSAFFFNVFVGVCILVFAVIVCVFFFLVRFFF